LNSQRPSHTELRQVLADASGFTIQELIVALMVGSMLVGYAFEIYTFAQRMVTHWRKRAELSEVVHSTLGRMSLDLQRASDLECQGDSVWMIRSDSRVIAVYRLSRGVVERNDVRMNNPTGVTLSARSVRTGELVTIEVSGRSGTRTETATSKVLLSASSAGRFARVAESGSRLP
jgi:Tfp pilus assembly protein PilW